jgi:hypothetical protein
MATHKSSPGQKITFETAAKNLHKLMFDDKNELSIIDDYGDSAGIKTLEIEPLGEEMLKVTAEILWVQENDDENTGNR